MYWGYSVRVANYMQDVMRSCPYPEGYTYKICIGKKGKPINLKELRSQVSGGNVLLVFGGHEGVEAVVDGDEKSKIQ